MQPNTTLGVRPWYAQLGLRFLQQFWTKAIGTTVYMTVFFNFYFYLLHHHAYPVTTLPTTWIDDAVPFTAAWVIPYISLWVYVSLPGGFQKDWPSLLKHGSSALVMCSIGLAFYYFFPTTFDQPARDWSAMPIGQILESVDNAGNAFPSMHVAYACFAGVWLHRILREVQAPAYALWGNVLWCLAISYSTLATKQHVWWDAASGTVLGLLAGIVSVALCHRPHKNT